MTQFTIFSNRNTKPVSFGKKMRIMNSISFGVIVSIPLIFNVFRDLLEYKTRLWHIVVAYGISAIFYGLIYKYLKIKSKEVKPIGTISFSTSAYKTNIGDYSRSVPLSNVTKIRLQPYMPKSTNSYDLYASYLLTVETKNDKNETLIVSAMSTDNKYYITNLLKTLKKTNRINLHI